MLPQILKETRISSTKNPVDFQFLIIIAFSISLFGGCLDKEEKKISNNLISIILTPTDAQALVGASQQFTATGTYDDGTSEDVTGSAGWSIDDETIATINSSGLALGQAPGTATITAFLGGLSGATALTVYEEGTNSLVSVTITPSSRTLLVGASQQFTATGTYLDSTTLDLTDSAAWSINDQTIATIDATGLAMANAPGICTVTALVEGITETADFAVTVPPQNSANLKIITPNPIVTDGDYLTVNIPEAAESIGIILLGTNTNYKLVDHGLFLFDDFGNPTFFITDPNGDPVPLFFNMIEQGKGYEEPYGDNLYNRQVAALFFPNDGVSVTLAAGTYTFPIASFNTDGTVLEEDTLQPFIFYKTSTANPQTMNVKLWVAEGVAPGITSQATAQSDPEIRGAISLLENIYQTRVGLNLVVNVDIVPASFVSIDSETEQDSLLMGYPATVTSDSLNLFIVGQLTYMDVGVIGYSAGIPGPFNLHGTVVSGTLAEYQGDGVGNLLGFTLAHEFGHFLGLWHTSQTSDDMMSIIGHDPIADTAECTNSDLGPTKNINNCPDRYNLMFPVASDSINPPISAGQIKVIQLNPAVSE